mgnify:CR=1 FL=1
MQEIKSSPETVIILHRAPMHQGQSCLVMADINASEIYFARPQSSSLSVHHLKVTAQSAIIRDNIEVCLAIGIKAYESNCLIKVSSLLFSNFRQMMYKGLLLVITSLDNCSGVGLLSTLISAM